MFIFQSSKQMPQTPAKQEYLWELGNKQPTPESFAAPSARQARHNERLASDFISLKKEFMSIYQNPDHGHFDSRRIKKFNRQIKKFYQSKAVKSLSGNEFVADRSTGQPVLDEVTKQPKMINLKRDIFAFITAIENSDKIPNKLSTFGLNIAQEPGQQLSPEKVFFQQNVSHYTNLILAISYFSVETYANTKGSLKLEDIEKIISIVDRAQKNKGEPFSIIVKFKTPAEKYIFAKSFENFIAELDGKPNILFSPEGKYMFNSNAGASALRGKQTPEGAMPLKNLSDDDAAEIDKMNPNETFGLDFGGRKYIVKKTEDGTLNVYDPRERKSHVSEITILQPSENVFRSDKSESFAVAYVTEDLKTGSDSTRRNWLARAWFNFTELNKGAPKGPSKWKQYGAPGSCMIN